MRRMYFPGGAHVEEPKSVYVGGDHRVMADTGVCFYKFSLCWR